MSNKVIIAVTNHDRLGDTGQKTGWYLPEVAHPYNVFIKAGLQVTFVSPKGGKAPMVRSFKYCYISVHIHLTTSILTVYTSLH